MRESQDKSTFPEVEAVVRRESEEALRGFRSGDFAERLKSRLDAPLPQPPFFLFRKPVFIPALGILFLAAAATFLLVLGPNGGNKQVEAGFRSMTESLARSDVFRAGVLSPLAGGSDEVSAGRAAGSFAEVLFRAAGGSETGSESEQTAPAEGGAPLRPLFSSDERFKILYEDQVILRVLTQIATHKEV
ncbi:MAG: hypothetical protein ACYDH3_02845 [Candidatus Aminicenantales bacterium]